MGAGRLSPIETAFIDNTVLAVCDGVKSFFFLSYNFPIGKHKSSKVKDVAATVHRKLKTFMEITLEEDSLER